MLGQMTFYGHELAVAEALAREAGALLLRHRRAGLKVDYKTSRDDPVTLADRAIEARLPLVIDGFQSFLRELRPEDLAGASGTYRIKEELLIRVNTAAAPVRARDVLVQELIQQ